MKLIFIDIDGTLYSHKLKKIPDSANDALAQLKKNGHKVFICTGRALAACKDFYNLDVDGFIFSAGAVVYAERKRIYSHAFKEAQVEEVSSLVEQCNLGVLLEGDAGAYQNEAAKDHNKHFILESMDKYKGIDLEQAFYEERFYPLSYRDSREMIYKICVFGEDPSAFEKFQNLLPKTYHGIIMNGEVESTRIGMELTLDGVNKSTGAQKICEYFNTTMEDAVAIGDSLNDYEIVRDSKIGISMGNGHPELKAIADYITDDVTEDGLAKAFKHYNLI